MKQLFLALAMLFSVQAFSQSNQIQIKISDRKTHELLMGANVQWLNSTTGATTNEHGIAIVPLPDTLPLRLVVSYVGYLPDTVTVKTSSDMQLQLEPEVMLSEIHVKARKQSSYISSMAPMKTEKIENAELKKAACCNLSESFQTNASVDVSYQDAVTGAKEIKLLGLSGIYVQNLLEGVPFMRGLSSTFGLDNIPSAWMKSISVSKGVPSVKNSYEGITGSMNVEFKSSFNDDQKLYFDLFANQTGRIETNLLINHKINAKLGSVLMANGGFTPVKEDHNHDGYMDQPKIKQYNLLNRWNYHSEKVEGQYMIKVLSENREAGETVVHHHHPSDSTPLYTININTKRVEGFAKTGFLINDESSFGSQFSGVYHRQRSLYGNHIFDAGQSTFTGNLLYQSTVKNDDHILSAGINFIYDNIDQKLDSFELHTKDAVPGFFTEYTFKYKSKITVVAGIRGDYHTRAGFQFSPRIHARFALAQNTTLRLAAGRGFRVPNVLSENQSLLASSRTISIDEMPKKEVGWNYGISFTQAFHLFNREGSISVDFFRTDFTEQTIVDIDRADNIAHITRLHGKSFSNSLLLELNFEVVHGLDVKAAYRLEDVRATYHGVLLQKPLQPLHKGLLALSYKTPNGQWQFDVNTAVNGRRRLPNSFISDNGSRYSPAYAQLNAQVLKYFKNAELFVGCENITNYRQRFPVLGRPYTSYFDTYQVYAPVMGATVYGGFRIFIK
jgi:outer membrane receptor protein involved in Fe transport